MLSTNDFGKEYTSTENLEIRKCFSCYQPLNLEKYMSWELIEFCCIDCIIHFHKSLKSSCATCLGKINDNDYGKYHMRLEKSFVLFCSYVCIEKYAKSIKICTYCEKKQSYPKTLAWTSVQLYLNKFPKSMNFCSELCFKNFVRITKMCPPEIPQGTKCTVCKIENPVTIIAKHDGNEQFFCGTRCQIAFNFVRSQMGAVECKMCEDYFTVIDSDTLKVYEGKTKISFCSRSCKNIYILLKTEMLSCNWCQRKKSQFGMIRKYVACLLENFFCCFNCCSKYHNSSTINSKSCSIQLQNVPYLSDEHMSEDNSKQQDCAVLKKRKICLMASKDVEQRNVATMCSVAKFHKSSATQVSYSNKRSQTDEFYSKMLLPVPVPIHVPTPMSMYSLPVPAILPVPIPIPVPIFLPCSQNALNKIIKKLQDIKIIPKNPCELEILKIAEIIAEDRCINEVTNGTDSKVMTVNAPVLCESNIKEVCENIDVEYALSSSTAEIMRSIDKDEPPMKKCCYIQDFNKSQFNDGETFENVNDTVELNPSDPFRPEMRLDHTLGINAWKQWASKTLNVHKNIKFIKSELLQMTPEELSFALCLFVKELRKPNGDEYAPDTIYYLCLGIQYYLNLNNRSDCIFFEQTYVKFIKCLDDFANKFCTLYDDESHFIVTRVEEEHLWETKQLGCWSPFALLNTLVYFNTKYYCRSNVREHMELSFFHIMKAYKKSKADNYFILRLYPRSKDQKQVYEQYQNKEDSVRCPVKLYEFYLSKCPESVKNSPNVLYLMPEKYVISESPLWYSTIPLAEENLSCMINRVKMIKEINVALLSR